MSKVLYFDYAAFCVFTLIMVSVIMKKMTRGKLNRQFQIVLTIAMVATAFDIGAIAFDNMGERHVVTQYIFHTGYLFFHVVSSAMYAAYVVNIVDAIHIFRGKVKSFILALPTLLCMIMLGVNFFTPCVFSIGGQGEYRREFFMTFLYVAGIFYMILGFMVVTRYHRRLTRGRFVSTIAIFPLVVVAAVFQMFNPDIPIEMFANAIGLLFVALLIQSPEQVISSATGLNKITRYMDDVRNSLDNGLDITVVMITMENDKTLRGILGVEEYHKLLREISEDFLEWSRPYGYDVEWYYLGTGMFRCVMNQRIKDQAEDFAERINEKLKKGYKYNDMFINLLPIICITRCPQDIEDVDSVMRFGGELAEHEYTGRVLYARDIYNKERYDLMRDMDMILDKAFAENRFEVYYQPIYSIDSGKYNSAEALLRLNDDMYGYISPEIFIPAAEENGMIHKIGKFVLEEVCRFIAGEKFKNLGLEYVEVNLSVIQCMSSELSEDVRAVMERYGVSDEQINLEITETAAAYAQTTMMDNINSLTDYGIAFSLDDFGTGYSNMKRIASMPFAIVKLDKTFADIDTDDKMMKVVKNTISMVKDMNMKIVVEGVETEESLREFSNLGVNYIQGYYFSRPLPQDKFISEVKRVNQS
ncbi:MAG: EAL domain-containing protein [Coprococcus sp.]